MAAPKHPLPADFGFINVPVGAHHLAPEVAREMMHATVKRPARGKRAVSGTIVAPKSVSQVIDLSPAVGKRRCWMADIDFRIANLTQPQAPGVYWQIVVQPYQGQTDPDYIVTTGRHWLMADTFQRLWKMPIGDDGKIAVNFFLGEASTDNIFYEITVISFSTTVVINTLPVPP